MQRRQFLQTIGQSALAVSALSHQKSLTAQDKPQAAPLKLTPPAEIEARVRAAQPLLGGAIPTDIASRLGATHYGGKYFLTQEPYIIEGCKALQRLGFGIAKLWFGASLPGYGWNSDWKLNRDSRLAEVAKHPYFVESFAMPFRTFALEIEPIDRGAFNDKTTFKADEEQFYELALHLLKTYAEREVTFILQHWEGDWMLRGEAGKKWEAGDTPEALERAAAFARWLQARQNGVNRARKEIGATRCRVFHASEANRVLDSLQGVPTICTHVLPQVSLDMVSWSSYDGMDNAVKAWHGLDIISHYARTAPDGKPAKIFIGEVGLPESGRNEAEIRKFWDVAMGVFIARDIPYIIHWELYCNEAKDPATQNEKRPRTLEEMRGFWLLRPDGSHSHALKYFEVLLQHAGKQLPPVLRS